MESRPGFGQVTDHEHIAAFAFVIPFGKVFLGNDPGGVDIQGVGSASELAQTLGHDPAMDAKIQTATAREQAVHLGIDERIHPLHSRGYRRYVAQVAISQFHPSQMAGARGDGAWRGTFRPLEKRPPVSHTASMGGKIMDSLREALASDHTSVKR